ncbi:hypothetical protein D9V29_13565 [Mycetocola manganoxydans]|uniref:Uncharacterized protein n=1 Tax=Mycetocola manganoxydans TaxID=699879 RepID=A0A3L6ZKJ9_9MICO|nr:hypothetical protein [Mycetocola manganoxydans]RLP68506.1 hypothetical protein D9V29_13565 [Mycetocola manganoxydans]
MKELVGGRAPHGGAVARAFRVVILSLIVTVFAAFAAHHAESLLTPQHTNAVTQHAAIAADADPLPDAASPAKTVVSMSVTDLDVLQFVGFGCAALALCALLGALLKSAALIGRHGRLLGGRTARVVAVAVYAVSRIPVAPSPAQLSISRT